MNFRVVAAAVILHKDEILLGRKLPGVGPYPDSFVLPGGGVKLGTESAQQAIIRELSEEIGIHVDQEVMEPLGFDEDDAPNKYGEMTHFIFLFFKLKLNTKIVQPGDDIASLEWVKVHQLKQLPIPGPSTRLFTRLGYL